MPLQQRVKLIASDAGTVKIGIASGLGSVVSKAVFEFRKLCLTVEVECRDVFSSRHSDMLLKHE